MSEPTFTNEELNLILRAISKYLGNRYWKELNEKEKDLYNTIEMKLVFHSEPG